MPNRLRIIRPKILSLVKNPATRLLFYVTKEDKMNALSEIFPLTSEDAGLFEPGAKTEEVAEALKTAVQSLSDKKDEFPVEVVKALSILAASFKADIDAGEQAAAGDAQKKTCEKCGAEVPEDADVCPECGAPLEKAAPPNPQPDAKADALAQGLKSIREYLASVDKAIESMVAQAADPNAEKREPGDILVKVEDTASKGMKPEIIPLSKVLAELGPAFAEAVKEGAK